MPDAERDLATLISASLVEPLEGGRLRLHQLLRDYATEQLTNLRRLPAEVGEVLGDAALDYWLAYAEAHKSGEPAAMDALEAEAAGLLGALRWAYRHARWRPLLDLVSHLSWTWDTRGRRAEERQFRPWAVEAAQYGGTQYEQWLMTYYLAVLDHWQGQVLTARARYEEALRLAREIDNKTAILAATHGLAALDFEHDKAKARARFEEILQLAREINNKRYIQDGIYSLAALDFSQNKAKARAGFEEALQLARELHDGDAEYVSLIGLADTVRYLSAEGRMRARTLIADALVISLQLGSPVNIGVCYMYLGRLEEQEGQREAAITAYRQALRLFVPVGSPKADEVRQSLHDLGVKEGELP